MGAVISFFNAVVFWRNPSRDILQNRCDVCREHLVLTSPVTICALCHYQFDTPSTDDYAPPLFPNVFHD